MLMSQGFGIISSNVCIIAVTVLCQAITETSHILRTELETITLLCNLTLGSWREMHWQFGEKVIYIFSEEGIHYPYGDSKYFVKQKGNVFDLTIHKLHYDDAGFYSCYSRFDTCNTQLAIIGKPV